VLIPLWVLAFLAAMVLLALGSIADYLARTVHRMFSRNTKTNGWNQLDIEQGQSWRVGTAISTSEENISKMTGGWNKAKVWEDLRKDQNWISGARQQFEADKFAWSQEQQRREEKLEQQKIMFEAERLAWKQELELQRMKLQEEKRAFTQEKEAVQKLRKEAAEIINAKAKLEEIVKSIADRSKKTGAKLNQLKNQVDKLPARQVTAIATPTTPPISPTLPLKQAIIMPVYTPSKKRARASPTVMTY
jgi:hypothetical protein